MKNSATLYKRYRFPAEIIQYTVWPYYKFNLIHRDIEDLLAERGIVVTAAIRNSRKIQHYSSILDARSKQKTSSSSDLCAYSRGI